MPYVPPPPGSTVPGQPTPDGVKKQDVHIADLPPEVRRSFLLSMVFFPTLVGATICVVLFLGFYIMFKPKDGAEFARELRSPDARRRWTAARELAESIRPDARIYHPDVLTALIEILENPELDKEVETWTPTSMIRPKAEDEQGSRLRWFAARMVGHVGGVLSEPANKDRALAALLKALDDKNLGVFAAEGLSFLKDPRALDPLVKQLESNPDTAVRAAAAKALGAIGAHVLSQKAADGEVDRFREPLRAAFQNQKDPHVLDNAAIALARLKDGTGKTRLQELEKNDDAVVRDHARRALEILAGKPRAADSPL